MELVTAPLPAGWTQNDCETAAVTAGLTPRGSSVKDGDINLFCDAPPAAAVTAWRAALTGGPPVTAARTREQLDTQLAAAMTAMQQIIDTADIPAGTLTAAQLSNHVRALQAAVKLEARLLRRIVRQVRGDLSGSD